MTNEQPFMKIKEVQTDTLNQRISTTFNFIQTLPKPTHHPTETTF